MLFKLGHVFHDGVIYGVIFVGGLPSLYVSFMSASCVESTRTIYPLVEINHRDHG